MMQAWTQAAPLNMSQQACMSNPHPAASCMKKMKVGRQMGVSAGFRSSRWKGYHDVKDCLRAADAQSSHWPVTETWSQERPEADEVSVFVNAPFRLSWHANHRTMPVTPCLSAPHMRLCNDAELNYGVNTQHSLEELLPQLLSLFIFSHTKCETQVYYTESFRFIYNHHLVVLIFDSIGALSKIELTSQSHRSYVIQKVKKENHRQKQQPVYKKGQMWKHSCRLLLSHHGQFKIHFQLLQLKKTVGILKLLFLVLILCYKPNTLKQRRSGSPSNQPVFRSLLKTHLYRRAVDEFTGS